MEWDWELDLEQFENCTQSDGHHGDDHDGHHGDDHDGHHDGQGWQCEWGHDWDGDGEDDYYDYWHFPQEDCEWSDDDGAWYCVLGRHAPQIEEGNHSMELEVEFLWEDTTYEVTGTLEICSQMDCQIEEVIYEEFNITNELMEVIEFHMETDNFTCDAQIMVSIHNPERGAGYDDRFAFRGPCEQPPSPFTLTYDGVEWEMMAHLRRSMIARTWEMATSARSATIGITGGSITNSASGPRTTAHGSAPHITKSLISRRASTPWSCTWRDSR